MEINGHDFSTLLLIARLIDAGLSVSEKEMVLVSVKRMRTVLGQELAESLLSDSSKYPEAVHAIKKAAGIL